MNSLFAPRVKVYSTDRPLPHIEADVVEALEAGAADCPHAMVWHEEVLLPAHEDVFTLSQISHGHAGTLSNRGLVLSECRELAPVVDVDFFGRTPALVFGHKAIFATDNLALEECGKGRVILGETWS